MTPTIAPHDAAARYIAAGCDGARGLLARAETRALLALSPTERMQWARAVADAFAAQMPVASDGSAHAIEDYEGIGAVVWVAADFLTETSRRQPWAGLWHWTEDDVPERPEVVNVEPYGDHFVATLGISGWFRHALGATEEEARANLEAQLLADPTP